MATFNSANGHYQSGNKTLFETQMLAISTGHIVDTDHRLPVDIGNSTINISGNVNILDIVQVNSTPENPVHTHLSEIGTSGILSVPYMPIGGNVVIYNSNGTAVTNSAAFPVYLTSNVVVNNTVTVANAYQTTQNVQFSNQSVNISGNVVVNNTITVSNAYQTTQNVQFSNQSVNISGNLAGITANVTVSVNNFPGNVAIYNSNGTSISLSNPISMQITKNGLAVSDTVGLPTRVINDEALISYARGKAVTEADVLNAYLIDKSGATENLGTTAATMSTVWSGTGLYPWTTFTGTGAKLYIKSVANDAKIQGKSITINGLDSNYDIIEETVTLHPTDTTNAVSTTNNFYRINRIYLTGANTNNLPHDYDIEVRYGSASGTLVSKFTAPWGRGQNCLYTVPRGYEAFILSLNGNSGKMDEITSSLWFHPYDGTWTLQKSFKFISGTFDHNFRTPLRITEKSDIEIRAFALVESSRIGTEFQILVLPKA